LSSNIIGCLRERGLFDTQSSEEIEGLFKASNLLYHGIDPTADSLHLGNLVGLIVLKWFQKFGHRPVLLIGGGTARIGDPSGKTHERPLLSEEAISHNVSCIKSLVNNLLDFSSEKTKPIIVNNDEWLSKLSLVDFLRDVGKHFRLSTMLAKESVKTRLNSSEGMSLTEFTYQMLQG